VKTFNRILLTLVLAVGVLLFWSILSRTAWASTVSLLGIGDNYLHAYQPLIKIAAVTTIAVTGVQLIQHAFASAKKPRESRSSAHNAA
jgi:hypothetical protein